VVLYNRSVEDTEASSVSCHSVQGERLLVDRLVEAGHRHFGIVSGPLDSFVGRERVNGATQALAAHGLTPHIEIGGFSYESGREGLAKLVAETGGKLDALICANDLMGIGALDEARHRGIDVPGALSVVGFDGVAPATWLSYQLTTIRQPVRRMTEAAVTMVLERADDPSLPPEIRSFAGSLIEGRSARLG
jgi:DNA-binding LacI/PurR family transcriptional regulator